ncbi:MAG: hypothetical protein EZS28_012692, partial [Streblomastix strix]
QVWKKIAWYSVPADNT